MALTATDLFNDATTREIGGVGPDQVNLIVSDLIGVQQMLSAATPQINNLSDLHTQIIINQLNEEIASVENANAPTTGTLTLGTDLGQFVGRAINDIHRDIIDIAQGDAGVQALFNPTPLPALNTPPAPFHDTADQTATLTQFIQDSNHLGQAATTIENNGFTGDIAGLVQQIQTFETNANAFDQAQGGLFSARFWNELRADGTAGTAANALIEGLQTQNAGEVNAAVQQLAANSADLGANNLMADGGSYADVIAAAQATAVTPTGGNAAADPQINNLTDLHTHVIINQLNEEIASIENANAPTAGTLTLGTDLGQFVGRAINDIHRDIIDIAQGDAGVQALFNPTPLPALNTPPAPFHDTADQTATLTQFIQDSNHLGQAATTIENNGFTGDIAGLVQQIQTFETNANAFDQAQGGLFSARFWNELRADGTAGTAANALIEGLQTQNAGEVNAAVQQLAANSADLGANNLMADGGSYADVIAAAQATAVTPTGGNAAADPQINNLTDLHTHVIINQLNEEIASIENANAPTAGTLTLGTDLGQFVGRAINDIHRDIIDIAQGDAGVQALFNPTPLPALNTPPAPFHDSADQTATLTQFIQDSNHLGQAATTIENNGFTGDIAGLVQQIQTFETNANAFDQAQGGLFSARFWNELRADGTAGTAANALIEGLQTQNAGEVNAAVQQLAANSADLGANNLMADGGSYADVIAAAQATAVTPTGGNAAADPQINNLTDLHTHVIINQLNEEIASIENANAPTAGTLTLGTDLGQFVGRAINDIHRDIIDIAQGDAGVQALFNPTPLPALNTPPAPFHDSADQTATLTQFIQDSNHLGQAATTIENNGFTGDIAGLVQQIQTFETNANAFDQAQGGLFSARFWNELRADGTAGTAANALIEGLQTQNAGEVNAAVQQLAANSADLGANNLMADGGSYADVIAAAQATAVTPTGGGAGGGGGGGDGGGAGGGGAGGGGAVAGLNPGDLYFENMFNDATRILEGGLWHNNVPVGNQGK